MFKTIKNAEEAIKVFQVLETRIQDIGGKEELATYVAQFRQLMAEGKQLDSDIRALCAKFGHDFDTLTAEVTTTAKKDK